MSRFIRGPGLPRGRTTDQVTSHTDLIPTIFEPVGVEMRDDFDGAPIHLHNDCVPSERHEHVNLEYWGFALAEGRYGFVGDPWGKFIATYVLYMNMEASQSREWQII